MNDTFFDFLVFIGRFQPFHAGHLNVVREGLHRAKHLIILVGSAHQPRSTRNPWTVSEREAMIRSTLSTNENARVHIAPLMDSAYNDEAWILNVQSTVNGIVTAQHGAPHRIAKIGLIGHSKDQSSYYLNLFPQWGSVNVESFRNINATSIRERVFQGSQQVDEVTDQVPASICAAIKTFAETGEFEDLKKEQEFVTRYKKTWANVPYPPTFVTCDAVVVQSGHVLMIKRRSRPGKGLLALPGGFVNQGERLEEACIRELREETKLKVPVPVLKGQIKSQQVFDDPNRSARGRTITHAFYIELAPNKALPQVKGGSDARSAQWIPLADLDPSTIFEDHYFIIRKMTGM